MGFQLWAHEPMWRVVEVLWTSETTDGAPRIVTGQTWQRRTRAGAERLRDSMVKRWPSRSYVVQGGIVTWYPDDELTSAWGATDFNRTQNYDDRAERVVTSSASLSSTTTPESTGIDTCRHQHAQRVHPHYEIQESGYAPED